MKKSISKASALLLVSIFLISVFTGCDLSKSLSNSAKGKTKIVKSTDGFSQITVPESWSETTTLNEAAVIQVANAAAEKYLIVISEPKEDFSENTTVDDYYNIILENFKTGLENANLHPPVKTTVNGKKALQFEVQGEVNKIKAAYIVTIVETDKNFHQIMSWTLQSRYEKNKAELLDVVSSFKEVSK